MSNLSGLLPAGGGAWTLVSTMTPSAASTIEITDFTAYKQYKVIYSLKCSATHTVRFKMKLNGSWRSTYYAYRSNTSTSTTNNDRNVSSTNSSDVNASQTGNDPAKADRLFNFEFLFTNPTETLDTQQVSWKGIWNISGGDGWLQSSDGIATVRAAGSGVSDLEGFRLYSSSGTLTGTVYIYGLTAMEI